MESLTNLFHSTLEKVTGKSAQQHADDMKAALKLPSAMVNDASARALGASPEPSRMTMTGGRRRKPRGKKARKTRRR